MAGASDYSYILTTVGLEVLQDVAYETSAILDADGAPAQASMVRQAFLRLLSDLERIAKEIADFAQDRITAIEVETRVRDDTHGEGGPRLGDFLGHSHALPQVEGAVGINYEPDLDTNVPWWVTNEDGSDARVGDEITGFFFTPAGGGKRGQFAPPHMSMFREHPLFAARSKGPVGEIQNPIPDRHFLARGAKEAEARWHREVKTARERFEREVYKALGP